MTTLVIPGQRRELAPPRPDGPLVVAVWGGKGGIGKTTSAFELADGFACIGKTLLVNADLKQADGGATELANLRGDDLPFELMESEEPTELRKLKTLRQFRYIVTDNAPHRETAKLRAAADADLVVVPMPIRHLDVRGVMSSIRLHLQPIGAKYKVLLTSVEHARRNKADTMQDTMRALGMPVYKTTIRRYDAHENAGSMGVSILLGEGTNWDKAAGDTRAYVNETLDALGESFALSVPAVAA